MIAITGATGQLGHYVIESLMKTVPALADWIELNLPEVLAVRDERASG